MYVTDEINDTLMYRDRRLNLILNIDSIFHTSKYKNDDVLYKPFPPLTT